LPWGREWAVGIGRKGRRSRTAAAGGRASRRGAAHWLIAEHFGRDLGLAEVDDAPLVAASDRVLVALAQEAQVVGVLQLLDPRRIAPELFVKALDAARVLRAAMNE